MTMCENIKQDFARVYEQTTYPGKFKKTFITVTNPGFQAVLLYRVSRWLLTYHIPLLGLILQRLSEVWTGVSIPADAKIGPGLLILHFGGIIINDKAVLGSQCTLHHGVTIGNKNPGGGSPTIGERVIIGAGAKVLGEIKIGNDVEIGANAVLLESLPDGAVAVGIPAKIIRQKNLSSH